MPFQFTIENLEKLIERPAPQGADALPPKFASHVAADANYFTAPQPPEEWRRFLPTFAQVGRGWTGLCSAGTPITRRMFAKTTEPCHQSMTERGLEESFQRHGRSEILEDRLKLFDNFNKYLAPRLTLEESFLQVLAQRFAYTALNVSTVDDPYWLDCRVSTDLRETYFPDHAGHNYHGSYHVQEAEKNPLGCTAFLLEPGKEAGLNASKAPRIILFRGTYNYGGRDILAKHAPTGWATNLDPENIGARAFSASQNTLVSWVGKCIEKEQRVVITGHSLGGAQALQLMAALTPTQQLSCRLVTFGAPGVSHATVKRIVVPSAAEGAFERELELPSRIKMIWHEADPVVHLFGEGFPDSEGTRVIAKVDWDEIFDTHSRLYLLVAEAWRGEMFYREESRPCVRITAVEFFRKYFGNFTSKNIAADWPFH